MTAGHGAPRRVHSAFALARLALAAVEGKMVSITSYTTNATSGSILCAAVAGVRATVLAVDENDRGLLITRSESRS